MRLFFRLNLFQNAQSAVHFLSEDLLSFLEYIFLVKPVLHFQEFFLPVFFDEQCLSLCSAYAVVFRGVETLGAFFKLRTFVAAVDISVLTADCIRAFSVRRTGRE